MVVLPAVLLKLIDVRVTLCLAVLLYLLALGFATRLRRDVVAATPAGRARSGRSCGRPAWCWRRPGWPWSGPSVGFLTFQLAFLLRGQDASVVWFGLVLLFSAVGTMAGNVLGPILRQRRSHEERMLELAFALIAVGGLVAAFGGGQVSAALLAGAVGVAAVVRPAGLRRHRAARTRPTPTGAGPSRSSRPSSRSPGSWRRSCP